MLVALLFLLAVGLAGLAYQSAAESADLARYPPPGRMIDIGGRRLHLVCAGAGTGPTLVFEAGSGNDSTFWHGMVNRLSADIHACTYDRAGLGWSDPAAGKRTLDDRANDLHALLARADIPGPYIIAGHSFGAYVVRRFAALFPGSVAGVVLIDSPDELYSFAPEGIDDARGIGKREWRTGWVVQFGLARLAHRLFPSRYDPMRGVPDSVHDELMSLYLRSARHFATADEMAALEAVPISERGPHGLSALGDTPLVVVSSDGGNPEWQAAQARLATLSTRALHLVARHPGHMVQFTDPEVIVQAVRSLLDAPVYPGGR